jgi:hypothetical protein
MSDRTHSRTMPLGPLPGAASDGPAVAPHGAPVDSEVEVTDSREPLTLLLRDRRFRCGGGGFGRGGGTYPYRERDQGAGASDTPGRSGQVPVMSESGHRELRMNQSKPSGGTT